MMTAVPRRGLRAGAVFLVAATAIGLAPTVAAAAPVPDPTSVGDAFYVAPDPLPTGKPGDVIRSRQTSPTTWQVMYLSTNALGQPDEVTGTVLVPKGTTDHSTLPIVALAVGTQGPAFRCAASKNLNGGGFFYEFGTISDHLNAGYAVAVTDYEGYSPTTTPTYVVGRSEGPAVLDSVRAAQRLAGAGLSKDAEVVVQGYSQGGGASLWAAEMQPTYAPEMNLVGAVAGGVPADLAAGTDILNGGLGFGFLAFAAIGLDAAYPELRLDSYLNDAGRSTFAAAKKNDCVGDLLKYAGKKISDYTTTNPLTRPDWQARTTENKLGANPPRVPVLQYHALADEIIPLQQAETLRRTYCAAGVRETWTTYVAEHATGLIAGAPDANAFIRARFAGRAATSNC